MPMSTREAQRAYQREWIRKRRQAWIDEHGPCVWCGSDYKLEVDHVDRKTKLIKVSSLWGMSEHNPKRIVELAKCQVLCEGCHLIKSNDEQVEDKTLPIKHGTQNGYNNRGCRCVECMSWRAKHWAETRT